MNNRVLAMLLAVGVAGCGSSEHAGSDAGSQGAPRAPLAAGADAVAAVLQSPGTPVAKLGFALGAKPVAGVPATIRLDISAPAPIADLQLSAEADGVSIETASAKAGLAVPASTTVNHELRFTPQRDGLTAITVRLRAGEGAESVYAIPVLVVAKAAGG